MRIQALPAYHILLDTAGRINEDNARSPIVTAAACAIAGYGVTKHRAALNQIFCGKPMKWRDGGLPMFSKLTFGVDPALTSVAVYHVFCPTPDVWRAFWARAGEFTASLERQTGRKARYASPSVNIRALLFANAFAHVMGNIFAAHRVNEDPRPDEIVWMTPHVICDLDITDKESQTLFGQTLWEWARDGRFPKKINLAANVTTSFSKEEDEQLLYFPDYVAGAFQHSHQNAMIEKPIAHLDELRGATDAFRKRLGPRFNEVTEEFSAHYPL